MVSEYNKYFAEQRKKGKSAKEIGEMWRASGHKKEGKVVHHRNSYNAKEIRTTGRLPRILTIPASSGLQM